MDILISSNLERLLYLLAGSEKPRGFMESLAKEGRYSVGPGIKAKMDSAFVGYFATEEQTFETIKKTFTENKYLCDTHTAVALHCAREYRAATGDLIPMVTASTASPYKFASNVLRAVSGEAPADEFAAVDALEGISGTAVPAGLAALKNKQVRFERVIPADAMLDEVYREMGIV